MNTGDIIVRKPTLDTDLFKFYLILKENPNTILLQRLHDDIYVPQDTPSVLIFSPSSNKRGRYKQQIKRTTLSSKYEKYNPNVSYQIVMPPPE